MNASASIDLKPAAGAFNVDTNDNGGNIRFRHAGEKRANVLMADGHVEAHYLTTAVKTTLKRGNINVNVK